MDVQAFGVGFGLSLRRRAFGALPANKGTDKVCVRRLFGKLHQVENWKQGKNKKRAIEEEMILAIARLAACNETIADAGQTKM